MPRTASPAVRTALVEHAAEMLARREPVTLRALVARAGTSTMAVYTHFGGFDGLWRAVRQEGFRRLAERLARVRLSDDAVRDLMALGAAYVDNAMSHPYLYRTMFDAASDLEDPAQADEQFQALVRCAERARRTGRFGPTVDPQAIATELWAVGHGFTALVLTGVLPREILASHVLDLAGALFVAAGDTPARCRNSIEAGWAAESNLTITRGN